MSPTLRLVLSAPQAIVRRGLASLAQSIPGVELIGEAHDLQETIELCALTGPDLLLLDSPAAPAQVASVLAAIRQKHPHSKAILLVSQGQDVLFEAAQDCLTFYLSREVSEAEFCQVLQHVGFGAEALDLVERPAAPNAAVELPAARSVAQELAQAGQMQANILPASVPTIPGYDLAARLLPVRETSGDFYDFIPITDNHWGFIIADVADKGMGAALFMSLTSTLFRSFAPRHPTLPALTLDAANARLLSDTRGGMFVTAFFGVLEPHLGRLRYTNAGHPPPLLVKSQRGKPLDHLAATGMALGVQENYHWTQKLVTLAPGDVLVLYTDGILEAQAASGEFFGADRLQTLVRGLVSRPAAAILAAILNEIQAFTANAPSQDDIALIVIRRQPEKS
jgi:serine phosphatase RsbU (regulator of sigma subunit)